MRSPLHPNSVLQLKEIEPGLVAYECPESGGIWIPLQSYTEWQTSNRSSQSLPPTNYPAVTVTDADRKALLCPESGCLLIRYRVGHGLNFQIDRSPVTGGVWLDKGEWDALKSKQLHSELHLIFTAHYQRQIRSEESERALEQAFQNRIGDDFERVAEFKRWLDAHPHRHDICCYLTKDLPNQPQPHV
jgi:Zn-finger nucleic acid-binding protein